MTDTNHIEVLRSALVRIAMGEPDAQKIADDAIAAIRALSARASAGEGGDHPYRQLQKWWEDGEPIPTLTVPDWAIASAYRQAVSKIVGPYFRAPNALPWAADITVAADWAAQEWRKKHPDYALDPLALAEWLRIHHRCSEVKDWERLPPELLWIYESLQRLAKFESAAPQPAQAGASGGGEIWTYPNRNALIREVCEGLRGYRFDVDPVCVMAIINSIPAQVFSDMGRPFATPASPATGRASPFTCDECGEVECCPEFHDTPQPAAAQGGWLLDGNLIYRLSDERQPQNTHEIKVTQWNGSRNMKDCDAAARELYRTIAAAPQPQECGGEVSEESLRAWRKMADEVHGRFFWRLSPDKHGNHTVSHESVRAVVELCEEIEAGTPAYENLTTRPTPEAQEARDSEFPEPSAESLAKARIEALTRTALDSKMAKAAWIIDRARAIDAALALPAQGEGK